MRCVDWVRYGLGVCVWGVLALDTASWVFLGREEVSIVGAGIFYSHTYEQFNLISTIQNLSQNINASCVGGLTPQHEGGMSSSMDWPTSCTDAEADIRHHRHATPSSKTRNISNKTLKHFHLAHSNEHTPTPPPMPQAQPTKPNPSTSITPHHESPHRPIHHRPPPPTARQPSPCLPRPPQHHTHRPARSRASPGPSSSSASASPASRPPGRPSRGTRASSRRGTRTRRRASSRAVSAGVSEV